MEDFRVAVTAGIAPLQPDHPAVLTATAELEAMLRTSPSALVDGTRPTQNPTKGPAHDLVVELGGAGGLSAAAGMALRAFRLWLQRDQRRSLTIQLWNADGQTETVTITGETVSDVTLQQAIESLRRSTSGSGAANDPVHSATADEDSKDPSDDV